MKKRITPGKMKEIYSVFNTSKLNIEKIRDTNTYDDSNFNNKLTIEKSLQLILTMLYKITKNQSNGN